MSNVQEQTAPAPQQQVASGPIGVAIDNSPRPAEPIVLNMMPQPEPAAPPQPEPAAQPEPQPEPIVQAQPAQTESAPITEVLMPQQPEAPADDFYSKYGIAKDDPEFDKLLNAWKAGKLKEYAQVAFTDYDSMDDMTLLRMNHDKKYSALSPQERDLLFKHELETTYNFTGDDELDTVAKIKIKNEAASIREELKKAASQYDFGSYRNPNEPTPDQLQQQKAMQEQQERALQELYAHPDLKQFETTNVLKLGYGEETLSYEISNADVKALAFNPQALISSFIETDASGKSSINMTNWLKVAAYAKDVAKYEKALIDYGKSLAEAKHAQELINPAPVNPVAQPDAPKPSFEFVGNGRHSTYREVIV